MSDLISREALKKAFANSEHIKETVSGLDVMEMLAIIEIIDNAPAVDFIISPNYVTELQNLNKELTKQLEETERPQGEWIITDIGFARCPFCNCEHQYPENYCGYCGADLRSEDNV